MKLTKIAAGNYRSADDRVRLFSYVIDDERHPCCGQTRWQIEIDGTWPGTDPFYTRWEAVEGAEALISAETAPAPAPKAPSYHPGRPTAVTKRPDGTFSVDSFRGEGSSYVVHLTGRPTCSCPHFQHRLAESGGECKHIASAKEQERWIDAAERARKLSDDHLNHWLRVHQANDNLIVAGAIRFVRAERKAAALRDAELRAVFA